MMGAGTTRAPLDVRSVSRALEVYGSPGDQKLKYLLEHVPEFVAKLLPSQQQLTLTHQGNGRYTAAYDPGDVSGVYQIFYYVTAGNQDIGQLQRSAIQSVYTRFGDIDMAASDVTTTSTDTGITINFRPKASNGRFIGPSQGSAFTVEGDGINLRKITDHQDGSYTLVLAGDRHAKVSIKLLGEEIYQGAASKIEGKKSFFEQIFYWPIWLIIVIISLLLIRQILRIIGASNGP